LITPTKFQTTVDLDAIRVLPRALDHCADRLSQWVRTWANESTIRGFPTHRDRVETDGCGTIRLRQNAIAGAFFLQPRDEKRQVHFGMHKGPAAWQEVARRISLILRRIVVTRRHPNPPRSSNRKCSDDPHSPLRPAQYFPSQLRKGRHLGPWSTCTPFFGPAMVGRRRVFACTSLRRTDNPCESGRVQRAYSMARLLQFTFFP